MALLVSNEKCSARTKATVASHLLPKNVVRHLIVIGDESDSSNENTTGTVVDDDYFHNMEFQFERYDYDGDDDDDWSSESQSQDYDGHLQIPFQSGLVSSSLSSSNDIKRRTTSMSSRWNIWDNHYNHKNHGKMVDDDDTHIGVSILYLSHEDGLGMYYFIYKKIYLYLSFL